MAVILVIPAHNEEETIAQVVTRCRRVLPQAEVVVVNDASTDQTAKKASCAGARVLSLPLRMGYWGALQTGLLYGFRRGCSFLVTLDADGQHPPEEIPKLLRPLEKDQAEVVIGACPARGGASKKLAWRFFRLLTGIEVEDLTSGFRAYNQQALALLISEELLVFDNADLATLFLLKRHGLRLREVPVVMSSRQAGESKLFSSPRGVLRYLLASLVLSLSKR